MERDIHAITPLKVAIITIILIIIVIAIYIFIPKKQDEKPTMAPELIHLTFDNTVQNHILFSDIKVFKQDESFYVTAKATNMTSNTLGISPITITLKDKQNNDTVLTSYIGDTLTSEDSRSIVIKTNKNLKNTKNIDINIDAQVQS
ncbi:unknown [Firmicutes bacterium CAG:822]|nr:unknown [Firmicutes bacterium CAG:822]